MEAEFFIKHAQMVHAFIGRIEKAGEGIKANLKSTEQARAAEFFLRLTALLELIKYACASLGLSFDSLKNLTREELDEQLNKSVDELVQSLRTQVYPGLQRYLVGCTNEAFEAGYKKAVIELHAQIERTFWTIEAFATESRRSQ